MYLINTVKLSFCFVLARNMYSICINVLHLNSDVAVLQETLMSIYAQNYTNLSVNILTNVDIAISVSNVKLIRINNINELPHTMYEVIESSNADLFIVAHGGDCFFQQALHSVSNIFSKFSDIEWLTGIETIQSSIGYNVIQGNTSVRRWNSRLFRKNIYQGNTRYIPSAGTIWRKTLWNKVKDKVNFVSDNFAHDDLWDAFLSVSPPYACDVYFSAKAFLPFEGSVKQSVVSIETALSEKGVFNRVVEFLYLNNVPYLRAYYRYVNGFAQVIRFDHKSQSYFLSDY